MKSPAPNPTVKSADQQKTGLHTLIAVHHPTTRQCLHRNLKAAGTRISQVFNGADALLQIYETAPDLLFLDLSLPILDGLSVLADLQLLQPRLNTKIIVLYRPKDPHSISAAIRLGAFDFLPKPLQEPQVKSTIAVAVKFLSVWGTQHWPTKSQTAVLTHKTS